MTRYQVYLDDLTNPTLGVLPEVRLFRKGYLHFPIVPLKTQTIRPEPRAVSPFPVTGTPRRSGSLGTDFGRENKCPLVVFPPP